MYIETCFDQQRGKTPLTKLVSFITIMQLCLGGLSDRSRLQANAAMLGVSLLMEDVLNNGRDAEPVRLYCNKHELLKPNEVKDCFKSSYRNVRFIIHLIYVV